MKFKQKEDFWLSLVCGNRNNFNTTFFNTRLVVGLHRMYSLLRIDNDLSTLFEIKSLTQLIWSTNAGIVALHISYWRKACCYCFQLNGDMHCNQKCTIISQKILITSHLKQALPLPCATNVVSVWTSAYSSFECLLFKHCNCFKIDAL